MSTESYVCGKNVFGLNSVPSNTCYFNSVLQLLLNNISTPSFKKIDMPFIDYLSTLLRYIKKSKNFKFNHTAIEFKKFVMQNSEYFQINVQHDAQELLVFLMSQIMFEIETTRNPSEHVFYSLFHTSFINRYAEITNNEMICVPLKKHLSSSLKMFFYQNFSLEEKEEMMRNRRWRSSFEEQSKWFNNIPRRLIISLNRYRYNKSLKKVVKLLDPCIIDTYIEIGDFLKYDIKETNENDYLYRIEGCIVHYGHTANSGHYTYYIRKTSKIWIVINDASCHEIEMTDERFEKLCELAYIFKYSKCKLTDKNKTIISKIHLKNRLYDDEKLRLSDLSIFNETELEEIQKSCCLIDAKKSYKLIKSYKSKSKLELESEESESKLEKTESESEESEESELKSKTQKLLIDTTKSYKPKKKSKLEESETESEETESEETESEESETETLELDM